MSDKGRTTVLSISSPAKSAQTSSPGSGATGGVKYRCEDIISCISALDEMLAEFDDTSLPYSADLETSCGDSLLPTSDEIAVTDSVVSVTAASRHSQPQKQSANHSVCNVLAANDNNQIVLRETAPTAIHSSSSSSSTFVNGNKLVDQNQNLDWNNSATRTTTTASQQQDSNGHRNSNSNNGPVIHTSHLLQIPVEEATSKSLSSSSSPSHLRSPSLLNQNHSVSNTRMKESSPEMNGNNSCASDKNVIRANKSQQPLIQDNQKTDHQGYRTNQNYAVNNNKKLAGSSGGSSSSSATASQPSKLACGGGTYSKGTSYEILIPKISSNSFNHNSSSSSSSVGIGKGTITTSSSHSSRASIMVPVIDPPSDSQNSSGNVGKVGSQLNMGIFQQPANVSSRQGHVAGKKGIPSQQSQSHHHSSHVPVLADGAKDGDGKVVKEKQISKSQHRGGEPDSSRSTQQNNNIRNNNNDSAEKGKLSRGGNSIGSVSSTYISSVSEGKGSLGQSSSSGTSSAVVAMMTKGGDEEQWNFPSEKNLPRSLRKTRKTCFLDEGDSKLAKPYRAESPYSCSISSTATDSNGVDLPFSSAEGRSGNCQQSPRVMPRKGISSKCEIVNKEDGHFALIECPIKPSWSDQKQQKQQLQTTVVSTALTPPSSSSSPNVRDAVVGRGNRKRIYEDVVLSKTTLGTSPLLAERRLDKNTNSEELHHQQQRSVATFNSSSPSSSFSSASGVSFGVTEGNSSALVDNKGSSQNVLSTDLLSSKSSPVPKLKNDHHQQPEQKKAVLPKPRMRQQIPAPGSMELPPSPKNNSCSSGVQNQFVPIRNNDNSQNEIRYISQAISAAEMMPSHHSPKSMEIETEEEHRQRRFRDHEDDTSSSDSPIKLRHPPSLRKSSLDTEFEETASDSKIFKMKEKNRRGSKPHYKHSFESSGQNGSLPNQSQMMRMMLDDDGLLIHGSSCGSSTRTSSSSSGSVSVKSSSSSENNCADVFHENIVQDYPPNVFNVAKTVAVDNSTDDKRNLSADNVTITTIDKKEIECCQDYQKTTVVCSGDVVVLRAKVDRDQGNVQPSSKPRSVGRKQANVGNAGSSSHNPANTTLDIDDGYLSMINRNEAPLLWPEEFIENETFSKDELKRLSVHLNDDDTDAEDFEGSSNSQSAAHQKPKKHEKMSVINKASFPRNSASSSSNSNISSNNGQRLKGRRGVGGGTLLGAGRSSTEKTDYFSDDSLEMDEDELLQTTGAAAVAGSCNTNNSKESVANVEKTDEEVVVRAATSFIIPFNTKDEKEAHQLQAMCQSSGGRDEKISSSSRKSSSQISKIPKILSPIPSCSQRRGSSGNIYNKKESPVGSHSEKSSPSNSALKKPCSFFIPFASPTDNSVSSGNGSGAYRYDRKMSSGDNTPTSKATLIAELSSIRSSSLPTSRRNSSDSKSNPPNQNLHQHHAITLDVSGGDKNRSQERLETKASSDIYITTDLSNKTVVVNNGAESSNSLKQSKGASSSPVSINNNSNLSSDKWKRSEDEAGQENREKQTVVEITQSKNIKSVETDDSTNRSKNVKIKAPSIPIASNNSTTSNSQANSNTTTITTTSIKQTASSPCDKKKSDSDTGDGGSLSKRHHHKFEKQQTFIVSPFRDTSTLVGQIAHDGDNTTDEPATTKQENQTLTITDPNGLNGLVKDDKKTTDDQTPDNVLLILTPEEDMPQTTTNNDRILILGLQNISAECKVTEDKTNALKNDEVKFVGESEVNAECKENNSTSFGGYKPKVKNGTFTRPDKKSEIKIDATAANAASVIVTQPMEKFEFENRKATNGAGDGVLEVKDVVEKGHPDNIENETHESVAEELESVVKMFLKATEGLLDPDEYPVPNDKEEEDKNVTFPSSSLNQDGENVTRPIEEEHVELRKKEAKHSAASSTQNTGESQSAEDLELSNISCLSDMTGKVPLMTSTPISAEYAANAIKLGATANEESSVTNNTSSEMSNCQKRLSFQMLSADTKQEDETVIEDLHDQPPPFIPEPPPHKTDIESASVVKPFQHHHHTLDGKVALDILSQRINRNCPSPVENMSVSQFLHNKKNIWAMFDRPYDDALPNFPTGYASRSQENLVDAMTHERLTKSFSARGQSSTLPLNCRPPPVQRRTSTFRNMFNKFRKHKTTDTVIPEGAELKDEEVQSITSRETGPSEGKKRGFFSRLFRRSRKH